MTVHRLAVRVYYEDTDFAGIVYHANHLKFFERGRTEALRDAGVDQTRLREAHGLVFVVARMDVRWRRPARFDDLLTIETRVDHVGAAALDLTQRALLGETVCAEAAVRCGAMTLDGRVARMPAETRAALLR